MDEIRAEVSREEGVESIGSIERKGYSSEARRAKTRGLVVRVVAEQKLTVRSCPLLLVPNVRDVKKVRKLLVRGDHSPRGFRIDSH